MILDYRKKRTAHTPILIDGAVVEQVESFKFLGIHITNKLTMVCLDQDSLEEGTTKPITPQEIEKIWHGSSTSKGSTAAPSSAWLHHCLVWQLLGLRPQVTTEGSANNPVHHWGEAPCHPGYLHIRWCQRKDLKNVNNPSHPSHRLFSATAWQAVPECQV